MKNFLIVIATFAAMVSLSANAVVVSFEPADGPYTGDYDSVTQTASIETPQGFVIEAFQDRAFIDFWGPAAGHGPFLPSCIGRSDSRCATARGVDYYPNEPGPSVVNSGFSIRESNGALFNLNSLDILNTYEPENLFSVSGNIRILGYNTAGDIAVSMTLTNDTGADFWETILLDSSWSNLARVQFDPSYSGNAGIGINASPLMLDSFTATVVPVPAAVWLFISGLSVLGLRRRLR